MFFVPFMISKSQHTKGNNVVTFDETTKILKVLSGSSYHSIPLNSIIKVKTENMGAIPVGRVMVPYKHSYGKLVIKYKKGNEVLKVRSNYMQSVEEVAIKIQSYLNSYSNLSKCL